MASAFSDVLGSLNGHIILGRSFTTWKIFLQDCGGFKTWPEILWDPSHQKVSSMSPPLESEPTTVTWLKSKEYHSQSWVRKGYLASAASLRALVLGKRVIIQETQLLWDYHAGKATWSCSHHQPRRASGWQSQEPPGPQTHQASDVSQAIGWLLPQIFGFNHTRIPRRTLPNFWATRLWVKIKGLI